MFNTTTPGNEEVFYTSGEGESNFDNIEDNLTFDYDDEYYDDEDDYDYNPYEDEYEDLNDEWLEDNYETNVRAKLTRGARNGGDWF